MSHNSNGRLVAFSRVTSALVFAVILFSAHALRAEVKTLRIAAQFGIGYLPLYVARDAGLMDQEMRRQGLEPVPIEIRNMAGAPDINAGLLSQSLEIGCGGITALMITWDKTRTAGDSQIKGIAAFSTVPYVLMTVNPKVHSLRDLSASDRIGLPAVKVSVPAIMLEIASEQTFGAGQYDKLAPLTVSLAMPDGVISLLSGGGVVDSYTLSPPFISQVKGKPGIHQAWSSTEVFGTPTTALVSWTTARFRRENPHTYAAYVAALKDAMQFIKDNRRQAAALYLKAESSKLSIDLIMDALADPDVRYAIAPENSAKLAEFLTHIGMIHGKVESWKDLFFPEIHSEDGS